MATLSWNHKNSAHGGSMLEISHGDSGMETQKLDLEPDGAPADSPVLDPGEAARFERDLMENLPMGVFIVDPVTRLVEEVNQQAADWFGAPKEQIIGRRCHAFVCPAAEHACPVCDLGSRVDRSERVLLRADGTRMAILKSVKRTRVDGREKLLECFLDLTERNRAEAERQQLQDRLRQAEKMESVGALAGGVAHDINNVLAAILASAEQLEEVLPAWPQAGRAVQTILRAGARGRDLVQSLTTFAHRDPPTTRPVDLNDLVANEANLLSRTTLQRIRLVLDLEPGRPVVLADPSSLANALMNLSINSLDAMEQGGTLTFRTRFQGDGMVLLEVADTGHGMSPEVLAKAMDPFFTTKPKGKGTGLGLGARVRHRPGPGREGAPLQRARGGHHGPPAASSGGRREGRGAGGARRRREGPRAPVHPGGGRRPAGPGIGAGAAGGQGAHGHRGRLRRRCAGPPGVRPGARPGGDG